MWIADPQVRRAIAQCDLFVEVLMAWAGQFADDDKPASIDWITTLIPQEQDDPPAGWLDDDSGNPGIGWIWRDGRFSIHSICGSLRGKPWPVTRRDFRLAARNSDVRLPAGHDKLLIDEKTDAELIAESEQRIEAAIKCLEARRGIYEHQVSNSQGVITSWWYVLCAGREYCFGFGDKAEAEAMEFVQEVPPCLEGERVQPRLTITPITIREACAFVGQHHRHHQPPQGARFAVAVSDGESIRGVAIVGRPVSRMLDNGWTAEVTRVATDGCPNACSALYGAAWRAAKAMGYKRLVTYTLTSEPGTSLTASGWKCIGEAGGGTWNRKDRPRVDLHPTQRKFLWEAPCP